jgi:nitrogen fixation protein FixH
MYSDARPLTGRSVLMIALCGFGTIIAANFALAWFAIGTFPGLEVANSFAASQDFEARATAQRALGWHVAVAAAGGTLTVALTDDGGRPVRPATVTATLGRSTRADADTTPGLTWTGHDFRAPVALSPGQWRLHIAATAEDGTPYQSVHVLTVRGAP